MASEILCKVADAGGVDVKFTGDHISKRELLRVLKAIKFEYRRDVLDYQRRNREKNVESADVSAEAETENVGDLKNVDPERNSGTEGKGRVGEDSVKPAGSEANDGAQSDKDSASGGEGGEGRSGRERAIAAIRGEV